MESTEMISPCKCSASRRARSDLPDAVGPARNIGSAAPMRGRSSRLWLSWTPLEHKIKKQTCAEDPKADELRRGEDSVDVIGGIIASKRFYKRAHGGIAHEIRGKDLAIKLFAAVEPGEHKIENETEESIIDLGW